MGLSPVLGPEERPSEETLSPGPAVRPAPPLWDPTAALGCQGLEVQRYDDNGCPPPTPVSGFCKPNPALCRGGIWKAGLCLASTSHTFQSHALHRRFWGARPGEQRSREEGTQDTERRVSTEETVTSCPRSAGRSCPCVPPAPWPGRGSWETAWGRAARSEDGGVSGALARAERGGSSLTQGGTAFSVSYTVVTGFLWLRGGEPYRGMSSCPEATPTLRGGASAGTAWPDMAGGSGSGGTRGALTPGA